MHVYMGRYIIISFIIVGSVWGSVGLPARAAEAPVDVYFFYSYTCPHCAEEKIFLDQLDEIYAERLQIHRYEVTTSLQGQNLFREFAAASPQLITGVPATFIGTQVIVGYDDDMTTGAEIQTIIEGCLDHACPDALAVVRGGSDPEPVTPSETGTSVTIPILGTIDTSTYPLVGLTAVIAAVDGFNPCAMWVLLILIGLLLGMQNRRRMWALGATFIAASALVYFVFLAAWLEVFRFVGVVRWLQILIGLGAVAVGMYYLRRFKKMRPGECEVTNVEQKRKITDRIKRVVKERTLWIAIPGIIGVAFVVNLIELMCSAGLPAIYTQVLSISDLSRASYYLYLLLYVVIFMLDDMFVFAIAMITMKAVGTEGKFSRWATLIGGLAIIVLGVLLMAKPELLSFGG